MRKHLSFIGSILAIVITLPAFAATQEENRVIVATEVMRQISQIPEQTVPPSLLSSAYGVAVIPKVIKVGFGIGGQYGKGIMVVRNADNTWSNPSFVAIVGGSFGWQVGGQSTDIVLVFKTREIVDNISRNKLTLGADAAVAAGPVGRRTTAATDLQLQSEVYSYSRSRGLFAGVALEGTVISIDNKANAAYYGTAGITADQVFAGSANSVPATANSFIQTLAAQTTQVPAAPVSPVQMQPTAAEDPPETEVKTYAIEEIDD